MQKINLVELTGGGEVHNLSGHDRGQAARELFNIATLDESAEKVVIEIPDFVYTITPSFFQGMFAESVRALGGRDNFLSRYSFTADPVVLQQIDNGIRSSLMKRREILAEY
ncbi:hypothetical protein [Rhizobium sp. PP-F2F-G48]|uniref:hypothetical protein n=1 Tax=Rhizobium sp. PP-F2F-G48 TaxID=2135651 RepID=UPI00105331CE|nr:hypothetical protein [Rhizobium sp. PP-F2F-G48]